MCVAKGITGGYLPLAATFATQQIFDAFLGEPWEGKTFFHGHTYTGNPLACAAALASLDLFEKNDLRRATCGESPQQLADDARRRCADLPHVGDIRQKGFMVGIELVADKATQQPFDPKRRVGAEVCTQRPQARRDPPPARRRDRPHAAAGDGGGRSADDRRRAVDDELRQSAASDRCSTRVSIPGLFVTGTDTGVGKTVIAGAIADWFRRQGRRVARAASRSRRGACTGARGWSARTRNSSRTAPTRRHPLDLICPQRYAEPLAPAIAAERAKQPLDWAGDRPVDRHRCRAGSDVMIVEGVGGLMVPMDAEAHGARRRAVAASCRRSSSPGRASGRSTTRC